ncbi:MAG: YhbY family RNA-binding protein [Proteobacteria bacterium]|nr:YhbY family RNA-binding protein [Pseudomonadota bacterium]
MKRARSASTSAAARRQKPSARRQPARQGRPKASAAAKGVAGAAGAPGAAPVLAAELSERQRRHLRGLAHPLKPVIWLGNAGLTDGVAQETARALHDHELIKVKGPGGDREARDALFADLARRTGGALVHRIGNIAVLYRARPGLPKIVIPD